MGSIKFFYISIIFILIYVTNFNTSCKTANVIQNVTIWKCCEIGQLLILDDTTGEIGCFDNPTTTWMDFLYEKPSDKKPLKNEELESNSLVLIHEQKLLDCNFNALPQSTTFIL